MRRVLFFMVIVAFGKVNAQDRVFTYTYQTNVLNKGEKEIEVWTTMHNSMKSYYRGFDHRLEFETGLGGKLQTSFYLNYGYSTAINNENGNQVLINSSEYSFSNEWKYKLSDPVANKIGSALYLEYTLSPTESEIEGKILFDKQFDKTLIALNLVGEYASEKTFSQINNNVDVATEGELHLEFNYGMSYKLNTQWHLGLEVFNENTIKNSNLEFSVLWLGPCLSYNIDKFWMNITCMPQITNLKGGGLELNEHEKIQTRLTFSYAF